MLLIIFILFLLLTLGGGGWGYSRYGYASMSPAMVLVGFAVLLYFTGHLQFR